jgi:hypothetical protein
MVNSMNIKRLVLDVDKTTGRPTLLELAEAIDPVRGIDGFNIAVTEIDAETVGTEITVEGDDIDYQQLVEEIESAGAVVHGIDEIAGGHRLIENVKRKR